MEQALVGAAVGATIQVVLQNLLSGSVTFFDEIKRVYGFKKDLKRLEKSLLIIQDILSHADATQVNKGVAEHWLQQLEDVAFKADAVLDDFRYDLLRKKVENQNGERKKVTTLFPRGYRKLLFSIRMASKINNVNVELERINKEAISFGLQAAVTGVGHSSSVGLQMQTRYLDYAQTNSFSVEPNIIGRDDDVLSTVDLLVTAPSDRPFTVIPILGMGGLGKTALARKVFHHERIEAHFGKKIWVCVSLSLDAMSLLKLILETLTGSSVQGMRSEQAVLENIQKSLAGKKYLLVLDDVWNENFSEWDSFQRSISGISSVMGNCILITTRSEIVASNVQTPSTPSLRKLSAEECWSIIKAKAFQGVDVVPTEFEEVGSQIAKRCGGLPLAANILGGLLRGKSKDEWHSILTNQLLRFGRDDTVKKILKLSYTRLPSYAHKKCFAYCSVFPQDFQINRKQMIELWMAEGFLQADERRDLETVGDDIFSHLMQNSLFQDEARDKFGNIVHCKMHELVRDLACSIAKGTYRVRHVVVKDELDAIPQDQRNYLRTLFVTGYISHDVFPDVKYLYVLNLRGAMIEELPDVIGKLIHLRFLNASNTGVKQLPDSIGKLYNLESLWICEYDGDLLRLKSLPSTIVDLISLRHLHIPLSVVLPPGIGRLTSLLTLPHYKVGFEKGCRIGELGNLVNLKQVEIHNLERVTDKEEAEQACLIRKSKILRLVLKWNESRVQTR